MSDMIRSDSKVKPFMDEDFLLENPTASRLYHEFAAEMPIIDYHCHLPPQDIAEDRKFENLTRIWLEGDHYKWRAMRTNGVNERFITGDASDFEKMEKWAETVPYTLRNPLYHWSHLELRRYFDCFDILDASTCKKVWKHCNEHLAQDEFSTRGLLRRMRVEVVCTTDDPADDLSWHRSLAESDFEIKVLPAFRPDKAILIQQDTFPAYMERLGEAAGIRIRNWDSLLEALQVRLDFFHQNGSRLADHGLEKLYASDYSVGDVDRILQKRMAGKEIYDGEAIQFKSAILWELGRMYHAKDWTQQFHLGALRNNNSRMMRNLGADTGFDSIGDWPQAQSLATFLNNLDCEDKLARTILYNLNPGDNEVLATMCGNFNDGSEPGKIQFGSGWWFLDQKDGMERQMEALSNMGLISRFVGMLTDSRSFMSYPRHEYFRRILCNLFGRDIETGLLPNDVKWVGKVIQDICYHNAKNYFRF